MRKTTHAIIRMEEWTDIYTVSRRYREVNCRRQVGLDVKKFNFWEEERGGKGKGRDRRQRVRKGERGETRTGTREQRGKTPRSLLWASANVSERDREKKVHFPNNAPGSAGKVGLVFSATLLSRFFHLCLSPSDWFSLSFSLFCLYIVPRHNGFLSLVKAVLSPPPWHEQRLFQPSLLAGSLFTGGLLSQR